MRRVLYGIIGNLSNILEYYMVIFIDLFSVRMIKDYFLDVGIDRVFFGVRCLCYYCFGVCFVGGLRIFGRVW